MIPTILGTFIGALIVAIGVVAGAVQIADYIERKVHRTSAVHGPNAADSVSNEAASHRAKKSSRDGVSESSVLIANNLPPRGVLIGRDRERALIQDALVTNAHLIIIEGDPGNGKTALALEVAHECLSVSSVPVRNGRWNVRYEGIVWITARTTPVTVEGLVETASRTLEVPLTSYHDFGRKRKAILDVLRKRKTLLIVDNYENIKDEQVTTLVESIPHPSQVLITSRIQERWKTAAIRVRLDGLPPGEGLEMIADEAQKLGLNQSLYEVTGGSPLAIKWAIGQMRQPGQSVGSVINRLQLIRGDILGELLSESWRLLSDKGKLVLAASSLFASTMSEEALAAASAVPSPPFEEAVSQLVEMSLLDMHPDHKLAHSRFSLHPLTRAFALREQSQLAEGEAAVKERIVEYYLQFCSGRWLLQRGETGYTEMEIELPNILQALNWLHSWCLEQSHGSDACRYIIRFSDVLNIFLWTRGYWTERVTLGERALLASERLGDLVSAGRQAYIIGVVKVWQGSIQEADAWSGRCASFMEQSKSAIGIDLAKRLRALVSMGRGKYKEATATLLEVLEDVTQLGTTNADSIRVFADWVCAGPQGYRAGIVALMNEVGILYNGQRDYQAALQWLQKSRGIGDEIGDTEGLSITLSHLGNALLGLGEIAQAKVTFREALDLATRVGRMSTIARCYQGLGQVAAVEGDAKEAAGQRRAALELFERLGMTTEQEIVRHTLLNSLD